MGGSQASPDAPEGRKEAPTLWDPAHGTGTGPRKSGQLETSPEGFGFTAEDRQRLRKAAEDAAWLRSRQTIRSLDAEAHGRAQERRERHGRRWRRTGLETVNVLALAAVWLVLGVAVQDLYGVRELVAAYGAELPEDVRVLVACRPVALRRAFRNLLENASIHGVRATVRIAHGDEGPSVLIEDEGPGIPAAEQERVFEPFVRLDESRSPDKGGTGLGLAIARTIIRGHGGNIWLENRVEGGLRVKTALPQGDVP